MRCVVEIRHRRRNGLVGEPGTPRGVGPRLAQTGMRRVDLLDVGDQLLRDLLPCLLVGVGRDVVEGGHRGLVGGVLQEIGVDPESLRSKYPGQDDDEGAIGVGQFGHGVRLHELRGQVGGCRMPQDQSKFGTRTLQAFDGGRELGVQGA